MTRHLGTQTTVTYRVETTWPDTSRPEYQEKFTEYSTYAYCLADDPGRKRSQIICNRRPDLFVNVIGESNVFPTPEEARAVADLLTREGRLTAGWDPNSQEQFRKLRRGPLKARVVLDIITHHREVIK